jgi:hypothetical protein
MNRLLLVGGRILVPKEREIDADPRGKRRGSRFQSNHHLGYFMRNRINNNGARVRNPVAAMPAPTENPEPVPLPTANVRTNTIGITKKSLKNVLIRSSCSG